MIVRLQETISINMRQMYDLFARFSVFYLYMTVLRRWTVFSSDTFLFIDSSPSQHCHYL